MIHITNIICHVFCIGILFVLESGMIISEKSYEAKRFQRLIISDAIYVLLNIAWLLVDGKEFSYCIELNYLINVLISLAQAYIGVCYYRYLFYVITKKKQKKPVIMLPGLISFVLSATSYWTGWIFYISENNTYISVDKYHLNAVLFYFYLVLIAGVSLVKWKRSSDVETRKRASISSSLIIPPLLTVLCHTIFPSLTFLPAFGITLSIASVFVRIQKQNVNSNLFNTEIAKENATLYRNTVLSNALQFMVVNLTTNKVEELTIPKRPDMSIKMLIDSGSIKSNNYMEIVDVWCRNIIDYNKDEIKRMYDSTILTNSFNKGNVKISDTFRVYKRNGEISWCNQDIIMAKNKKTGDIIATITITDITEQKNQEQAFDYQQAIIEGLAYGTPSYWIVDINTEEFIDYKVENEKHNNIINAEGIGGTYSEFVDRIYMFMSQTADVSDILEYFSIETIRDKLSNSRQYVVPINLRYSKEGAYFQISYTQINLNGREAFILSTRDISDNVQRERVLRKEVSSALEKAEKASEAKSSFLFNMSHDIRTPMNAILGFNDIAVKYIDDKEKALDALYKAKISGEHMLSIINDILDIARIESGKMKLNIEVIDVKEGFSRFDDMFSLAMEQKGIDFKIINNTRTRYVYADYLRITQVMSNLLSNALKFTNEGGSVTLIANEVEVEQDGYVGFEFSIKDTGIGMSEEFQKKVFESFERENTATVSGVQGTGLGLAISKNLVELMGGNIKVKSKLGEGTEFIIFFNSKIAEDFESITEDETVAQDSTDLSGVKILIVEDNELNREIVCEILESEGINVVAVEDGSMAVELIETVSSDAFDLILMDVQMPVLNGYEATRQIRCLDDDVKKNIPIIAMTANAFAEDRIQALEAGMNEHIAKPIDVNNLFKIIRMFIK